MLIVAVTGTLPVLTAVKEGILPEPVAAKPIEGLLLVQLYIVPGPVELVKFIGAVAELWQRLWFVIGDIFGKILTMPFTATVLVTAPVDEQVILPDGEPEAEAVILAYIRVALTVPPTGESVIVPAKPLVGVVDISKPVIAVINMLLVNDEPETVNDCVAEADPSHVINVVREPVTVITWALAREPVRIKKQKSSNFDINFIGLLFESNLFGRLLQFMTKNNMIKLPG